MKCPKCGGVIKEKTWWVVDYHHCAKLRIEGNRCTRCMAEVAVPSGPLEQELRRTVTHALLHKPGRLKGPEIRFLRKLVLDLPSAKLSDFMGVWESTISRWEKVEAKRHEGQDMGETADRLLRLIVVMNSDFLPKSMEFLARLPWKGSRQEGGEVGVPSERVPLTLVCTLGDDRWDARWWRDDELVWPKPDVTTPDEAHGNPERSKRPKKGSRT